MTESQPTVPVRHRTAFLLAIVAAFSMVLTLLPAVASAAPQTARIDARLSAQVAARKAGPVQALLVLKDKPDSRRMRGGRGQVVGELKQVARTAQAKVLREMRGRAGLGRTKVLNSFWLQNMVLVEFDGQQRTLDALAGLPGVDRVIANFRMTLVGSGPSPARVAATVQDRTWGVDRIEATRVQDELGLDGAGVRVATLDTGVDITHPDLAGKMATTDPADPAYPGGWIEFDSSGSPVPQSRPHDSAEHGTHVSGTIHGGSASGVQIGVAPGATMMHGLVIAGGEGTFTQVAAGMQWALAPFDNKGDPAGRPADVINMSLGPQFGGYVDELVTPSRNAYLAGTVVVTSSGNCGTDCHGSPGNIPENIAVGNTTVTDDVAESSSGGMAQKSGFTDPPADWPDTWVVPDVSAPGTDILSSVPGGGYAENTGTSMASPHVAGTVALIRQAAPELSPAQVLDVLKDSSFFDDRYGTQRPNTRFGYGRVNAFSAVAPLAHKSGINGTVTNAAGAPLGDVSVVDRTSGARITTKADGSYQLRAAPGVHEIAWEKFGYTTKTLTVEVTDSFTRRDVTLDQAPLGSVSGRVTFAASGNGVPGAMVQISGTPLRTTSGDGGAYQLTGVPAGAYDLSASLPGFPGSKPIHVTVEGDKTATADLTIPVPPPAVGVLGAGFNPYPESIGAFLDSNGIANEAIDWDDDFTRFGTIVVNLPGDPGEQRFRDFLAATDTAGVGVIFLDTWQTNGNGIALLNTHLKNPAQRATGSDIGIPQLSYRVTADHPVLDGFHPGDDIVLDQNLLFKDHAWFDGYTGEGRTAIADVVRSDRGVLGRGIGVQQRPNNRHVLLSMHGTSSYISPPTWTPDAGKVFLNALKWTGRAPNPAQARFVPWNLRVDSDTTLSGRPVKVSVDITNIGSDAGQHLTTLNVDGAVDQSSTVQLAGGATTTVTWTVSRQELRTYQLSVGSLTASLRVRAPSVALTASTMDGVEPLSGATVELVAPDGQLVGAGMTGANGTLTFETTAPDGDYVVIVRRASQPLSYLLTRKLRISDDVSIQLRPSANTDSVLTLTADNAGNNHQSWTYLRNGLTGKWAFGFAPGKLVATTGQYEMRYLHTLAAFERDTWGVSAIVKADLGSPQAYSRAYGGTAVATLDAKLSATGQLTGNWSVADAHGNPFTLMARTDLRPFAALSAVSLEDLPTLVAGTAPNATEIVLRVYGSRNRQIYGAGLSWPGGAFSASLGKVDRRSQYKVELRAGTGGYQPGEITTSRTVRPA